MMHQLRRFTPYLTAATFLLIIGGVLFSLKNPVSLDDGCGASPWQD